MGFFSIFKRRTNNARLILAEKPRRFRRIGARTIDTTSAYALPSDMLEADRLNLQHYILRYALRGNYAVPFRNIGIRPTSILDVACGTGRWGAEMAREFPSANVVGIDIVPPSTLSPSITLGNDKPPSNYVLMDGDIRQGLPFEDNTFDYVHMRFLVVAIAETDWPGVIRELVRVTRPNGWIELIDTVMRDAVGSPAHQKFFTWFEKMTATRGFDLAAGEHIERRLKDVGLINMKSFRFDVPIGDWGGNIGTMMRIDVESAVAGIVAPVVQYGIASQKEADIVVHEMSEAMQHTTGSIQPFYIAFGQKAAN